MGDNGGKAYEAHIAAAILALGIQNINSLSQDQIDKVYDYALDSLYRAGINIEFPEIKKINELTIQEAQSMVIGIKSNIVAALQGDSNPLSSQLFELTFNIYLVSTTPEEFSTVGDYLKQLASQVGFKSKTFSKVLDFLKNDVKVGLLEYESAVKKQLRAANLGSFMDLFEIKPGVPGIINFDVKLLIERYLNWRSA